MFGAPTFNANDSSLVGVQDAVFPHFLCHRVLFSQVFARGSLTTKSFSFTSVNHYIAAMMTKLTSLVVYSSSRL